MDNSHSVTDPIYQIDGISISIEKDPSASQSTASIPGGDVVREILTIKQILLMMEKLAQQTYVLYSIYYRPSSFLIIIKITVKWRVKVSIY